jgi:Tfp pilus assembly protein PilO
MNPIHRKSLIILVLLWGGAFIVLSAIHMFLMLPQRKESELLGQKLIQKQLVYDSSRAAASEHVSGRLAQKVREISGELDKFVARVEELDGIWFSVSGIANEIMVDTFQSRGIDSESYSAIPNCYDIGIASVEVNFSGSFNKFARFVNQLERYEPVVFIDNFTITRSRKEDSGPETKLVLSVFVRVPEEDKIEEDVRVL